MDINAFELLEQRISKLLQQSAQIKSENEKLKGRNQTLQSVLNDKELIIQQMKQDSENLLGMKKEIETYKENHDRIRIKVESLLKKLKEFDELQ